MRAIIRIGLASVIAIASYLMLAVAPTSQLAAAEATWTSCAAENAPCVFTGTRRVRYGRIDGEGSNYFSEVFSQFVTCGNAAFGDPEPGATKACWYSSVATDIGGGSSGGGSSTAGQAPTPAQIVGKPKVGRIVAVTGQVIENVHVTNPDGPCIYVPPGVTNVTIRNSEVGPCGENQNINQMNGVLIHGSNVLVQSNVIHDVSAGVRADGGGGAQHPVVVDRNWAYNIAGPVGGGVVGGYEGHFVHMSMRTGTGQSKITCNVIDGRSTIPMVPRKTSHFTGGYWYVGDQINLYKALGSAQYPYEIAYNRIRGRPNQAYYGGSAITVGDGENGKANPEMGWFKLHHNTIIQTNGAGIQVAGGHDIEVYSNRFDQRGENLATNTNWSRTIRNFDTQQRCFNIAYHDNVGTVANLWGNYGFGYAGPLQTGAGLLSGGDLGPACTFTQNNESNADAAMTAKTPDQNWADSVYSECNSGTAPAFTQTQIFALGAAPASTPRGKDVTLRFRFYGRPLPTDVKPSIHLLNADGSDTGKELINHYHLMGGASWNGYIQYDYLANVGLEIGQGTYKVGLALYQGTGEPYTPYWNLTQCNGVALRNGTHCEVGTITVTDQSGPPSTVVTTDSQQPRVISGVTWTP